MDDNQLSIGANFLHFTLGLLLTEARTQSFMEEDITRNRAHRQPPRIIKDARLTLSGLGGPRRPPTSAVSCLDLKRIQQYLEEIR